MKGYEALEQPLEYECEYKTNHTELKRGKAISEAQNFDAKLLLALNFNR